MDHQQFPPKVSMINCMQDHLLQLVVTIISGVFLPAIVLSLVLTTLLIAWSCMQDQLRYPVSMPERATLSIYTLIDFFPCVDMTAWRCKLCSTPPDPPGTPITESPRWTVALNEGWAQREARTHLAELHDIRFDQHDHSYP